VIIGLATSVIFLVIDRTVFMVLALVALKSDVTLVEVVVYWLESFLMRGMVFIAFPASLLTVFSRI